jgi:hypothetical protein
LIAIPLWDGRGAADIREVWDLAECFVAVSEEVVSSCMTATVTECLLGDQAIGSIGASNTRHAA